MAKRKRKEELRKMFVFPPGWFSIEGAAFYLDVSTSVIERWMAEGLLPYSRGPKGDGAPRIWKGHLDAAMLKSLNNGVEEAREILNVS